MYEFSLLQITVLQFLAMVVRVMVFNATFNKLLRHPKREISYY
jgi:hypothetical protein